jgi:hypothetical protein
MWRWLVWKNRSPGRWHAESENVKKFGFYLKKFFTGFSGSGILRFVWGCDERFSISLRRSFTKFPAEPFKPAI